MAQVVSPARSAAATTALRSSVSPMMPAVRFPSATICAPVSVATSIIASGFSALAATRPSAMTRRPSASVLSTSTVLPPNMVMTSPGRVEPPPGMFSARHSHAVTLTGRPSSAMATMAWWIVAAPAMSLFMTCMLAAGLMEIPPVSNVMPLPTRARCLAALAGEYSTLTRRGPRSDPRPTPIRPP